MAERKKTAHRKEKQKNIRDSSKSAIFHTPLPKRVVGTAKKRLLAERFASLEHKAIESASALEMPRGVKSVPKDTKKSKLALKRAQEIAKKQAAIPKVTKAPVLVSVSLNEGPKHIARYSGLFFMLVGACFAARALTNIYVEYGELDLVSSMSRVMNRQHASVITNASPEAVHYLEMHEPVVTMHTGTRPITDILLPQNGTTSSTSLSNANGSAVDEINDDVAPILTPEISLTREISSSSPYVQNILVDVLDATKVELYVSSSRTLRPWFVGTLRRKSGTLWTTTLDTRNIPTGRYDVFVSVTNSYGTYTSAPENLALMETPQDIHTALTVVGAGDVERIGAIRTRVLDATLLSTTTRELILPHSTTTPEQIIAEIQALDGVASEVQSNADDTTGTATGTTASLRAGTPTSRTQRSFIDNFRDDIQKLSIRYFEALSGQDAIFVSYLEKAIDTTHSAYADRVVLEYTPDPVLSEEIRNVLSAYVGNQKAQAHDAYQKIRIEAGDLFVADADSDGLTDVSEQYDFATNPASADSDSDGVADGVEVFTGTDPAYATDRTPMKSHDARIDGALQGDRVRIESLAVSGSEDSLRQVVFLGTAPASSFVFLSVFSDQYVIPVRADRDGAWTYAFTGHLDVGQHEAYASLMAHDGTLFHTSKPLPFVIEKDGAITLGRIKDAPGPVIERVTEPLSGATATLLNALLVLLCGVVLILIATHIGHHAEKSIVRRLKQHAQTAIERPTTL
jgi:hypothetical protein